MRGCCKSKYSTGIWILCFPSGAANHLAAEWPIHCFLLFTSAYHVFASYFIPLAAFGFKSQLQAVLIL